MAEPMTKKIRVWNPAIEEMRKDKEPGPSPQPLDFSSHNTKPSAPMPMLFQNYMHLAPIMMRMQQQQMENAMRQRFLSGMAQARAAAAAATMATQAQNIQQVQAPVHNGPPPPVNPLVASALGVQPLSENCCAVCGAHFRLTGDLVTHMRNNHRTTRFKRKNEKPVD